MRKTRVYVAGPISSSGNEFENVRNAVLVGEELWNAGYVPHIPHLTCFYNLVAPRPATDWYEYDYNWLDLCDAAYRIKGHSIGADSECLRMLDQNKPVFKDMKQLKRSLPKEMPDD